MKLIILDETKYIIDILIINQNGVIQISSTLKDKWKKFIVLQSKDLNTEDECSYSVSRDTIIDSCKLSENTSHLIIDVTEIRIDNLYYGIFIRELSNSQFYRRCFLKKLHKVDRSKDKYPLTVLRTINQKCNPMDYSWSYRCNFLLLERQHLESVMSWLSTLGGAFSALGDFDVSFAEKASVTSYKQMIVACRLGNLDLVARCWLYCSLALIQKNKFKKSAAIIKYVYDWAKRLPEGKVDARILNMCQGIWTKLKYERDLYIKNGIQKIPIKQL